MAQSNFESIVRELTALSGETEWVEFKLNNEKPVEIGKRISAISNSAALHKKPKGFILWGVENETHKIVGTSFRPRLAKVGNSELENWLATMLDPRIDFSIREETVDGFHLVLFEIQPASHRPVRFSGVEYIRIGSYTKTLHDHPEKERTLWKLFDRVPFESDIAMSDVVPEEILSLLDYQTYFQLTKQPLPDSEKAILDKLSKERLIISKGQDRYDIANLGAVLFAHDLDAFDKLRRKALRVIIYKGSNRVSTVKEQCGRRGYAIGLAGALRYINEQLPQNEKIEQAIRKEVRMYPEVAIRELVANALIHQDFTITGSGPMVEIFDDRMEISNPGLPLIETLRFIDEPPRSRNEELASLMRRIGLCEERGSGIDKVIFQVELYQLPAPDFRATSNSTVAVLFGHRDFSLMSRDERIRACYQHACLQILSGKKMTNSSFRKRLGIKDQNYTQASRIFKDTLQEKLIKPFGAETVSKKDSSYLPYWA